MSIQYNHRVPLFQLVNKLVKDEGLSETTHKLIDDLIKEAYKRGSNDNYESMIEAKKRSHENS